MKKKVLSVLLSAILCLCLFPLAALAETPDLQSQINAATEPVSIKLTSNVKLSQPLNISAGKTVTIDLNGYNIDRGLAKKSAASNGTVMIVSGSLTIQDKTGRGAITGGNTSGVGGGVIVKAGGALTLNGGSIAGNKAAKDGGGIYLEKNAGFTMNGGAVSDNECKKNGGGILACEGFNVTGGVLSGNKASQRGGALYIYGAENFNANATINRWVTISGATISGNTAGVYGGGIYVHYYDIGLKMTNTLVTLNYAGSMGGGIYSNRNLTGIGIGASITLNSAKISLTDNLYSPNQVKSNEGSTLDAFVSIAVGIANKLFGR